MNRPVAFLPIAASLAAALTSSSLRAEVTGWLSWRGPDQNSVSTEKGLPTTADAKSPLWSADFPGQSTPVIADGRVYINGYQGDGTDLREFTACFDADTGKLLWSHAESDFLSDTIYLRYATSSPTVDPETGNIFVQGTQGLFMAFDKDGKVLWKHSLMEELGRLTFPNSRTATPIVDGELVITRGITSAWGAHGAAGDRFYAYDKKTGQLVWASSPGDRPQDNTFSHPYLDFWGGKRVLYSAGGDSSILAINARTGEPLWRFPFAKAGAKGGINAALVRSGDNLIAVHESENIDSSEIGRLAAFRIPAPGEIKPTNNIIPHVFGPKAFEVWRQPAVGSLASSPVVVGDTVYEVTGTGDLSSVDAATGKLRWKKKIGIEQRQSTPFYANGLLYVGVYVTLKDAQAGQAADPDAVSNGDFIILKPGPDGAEELSRTQVTGRCFGSPVGYNGKLYLQTDKKFYCWGTPGAKADAPVAKATQWPAAGAPASLQPVPYEVLLRPGGTQEFKVRLVDANGFVISDSVDPKTLKWEPFIPPTALVKSTMKGSFNADGALVADASTEASAGQFKATLTTAEGKTVVGFIKGRVLPRPPVKFDFESIALSGTTTNTVEPPTPFAYPPLPWNGARFKFEVRGKPVDGQDNKALLKTIDNRFFQRAQVFFGHPAAQNYTVEADLLSEGTKRKMSEVGLINQRYAFILKGNAQQLEINSNQERLKVSVPFKWVPETWYHLKTRVDVNPDGSGVARGKVWKRGDPEPDAWTLEAKVHYIHTEGAPGLFAFSPQDQRVAIDNIVVTPN
jgi:outer membrane protein assembly factor BamB